ncbi:glutathione S-transferase omega-1-like [Paramacrobiotus metropolitanus]|uniref:glutathione S-transferase omega-1-like n=1 Tax=Paramacrobiotus metropolitanus TaxID=2943436 RepID=UPI0024456E57|nr:glutathione S-transferase omega-1-like [Paramacrobiotus metropolitanus]
MPFRFFRPILHPRYFSTHSSLKMPAANGEKKHFGKGSSEPKLDENQLRLFSMRFCPYAERARLTLNIKKIPYEIVNINLTEKPEWYMAHHNPLGKVPTLHEPGKPKPVFESLIVAEYVDEHFPNEPKLLPKDEYEKARQKVAIEVITQKFINNLNAVGAKGDKEKVEELKKGLKEVEESLTGQYFAGDKMGFVDVMIWPWFERIAPV